MKGKRLFWKDPDEYIDEEGNSTSGWVIVDEWGDELVKAHREGDELAYIEVAPWELFKHEC